MAISRTSPSGQVRHRAARCWCNSRPDEYLLIGQHVRVSFAPAEGRKANGLIYASVEEGSYADGKWSRTRIWNGDQTDYGLNLTDEPRVLRVRLATLLRSSTRRR